VTIQRIGRFTIEKLIGEGAFGRVYRALDPNFRRLVAIKVLVADGDPDLLERFRAEAGTTAGLSHKNIVTVYGFEEENGVPYLQMELLTGKTLREVIDQSTVNGILEKVEIMYQAAEGLHYAHSRGVVHCDMKPANIMVLQSGSTQGGEVKFEVKIMDFGIARVTNQDGTWRSKKEEFAGTIPYMAPEQFQEGETNKLCDIFSFGTILYEFLSGVQPFVARDPGTVMHRVITLTPAPLLDHVLSLPEALASLVERMMSKEPELRVQDMQEVLLDLLPVLQLLRQERAAQLAVDIQPLLAANDFDGANRLVRHVLELDPAHREATKARRDLQVQAQGQARRAKSDSLFNEGRRHLAERRFAAAISCFDGALMLDQREDVRALREQTKQIQENVRAAGRLVAEARAEQTRGDLATALQKAESAKVLDPDNPEPGPFAAELREILRVQHNAKMLEQYSALLAEEEFDAAAVTLRELRGEEEQQRELGTQLDRVRKQAEELARTAARVAGISRTIKLRDAQKLNEAEQEALSVCAQSSGDLEAQDLLAEIRELLAAKRRREAIAAIHESAAELLKAKRYQETCILLREGLQHFREDEPMSALLAESETLAAAQQRESTVAAALADAEAKRVTGDLAGAIKAVDDALTVLGGETVLRALRVDLEAEQERCSRAAALALLIKEARSLMAAGTPAAALARLLEPESLWVAESAWMEIVAEAREGVRAEHEKELRAKESAILEAEAEGNTLAANLLAEAACAEAPDHAPFQTALARLKRRKGDEELAQRVATQLLRIDEAIARESWELAFTYQRAAQSEFPDNEDIAARAAPVQAGRYKARWARTEQPIRAAFAAGSFDRILERILAASDLFPDEPALGALWVECKSLMLADESKLDQCIRVLESLELRGLADLHVSDLLETARTRWAGMCDKQAAEAIQGATLQAQRGQLNEALGTVEAALKQLPDHADLRASAVAFRNQIMESERSALLAGHFEAIQSSIQVRSWDQARSRLTAALEAFPDAAVLKGLGDAIQRADYEAGREEFEKSVAAIRASGQLQEFAVTLAEARQRYGEETLWRRHWAELEAELASPQQRIDNLARLRGAAQQCPTDQGLSRLLDEASKAVRLEGELKENSSERIARCLRTGDLDAALAEALSAAERFPSETHFQEVIREVRFEQEKQQIAERVAGLARSIRAAIERAEWDRAEDLLAEAQSAFTADPTWIKLGDDLREQQLAAQQKAVDEGVRDSLGKGDWAGAARKLAGQRSLRNADPLWLRLVTELEARIPSGRDRPAIMQSLQKVAEEHRDFGELHSLLARLQDAEVADRHAAAGAAQSRIREYEQRGEWDLAIREAEAAAREFPDSTVFSVTAGLLRQKQTTQQRAGKSQALAAQLEALITEERWADAEECLSDALRLSPDSSLLAGLAARVEAHRAEAALSALETSFRSLLDAKRFPDAAQLLAQAKATYSQNAVWQRLRKTLDHHSSYEAGLQQAEKAWTNGETSRVKSILKWLVKDAPDSRAKDLMQTVERAAPRKTRRTR
jgi:hypothetical protein